MAEPTILGLAATFASRALGGLASDYVRKKFASLKRQAEITEFDVVGLAWERALDAIPDSTLTGYVGKPYPDRIRRALNSTWFTATLLDHSSSSTVAPAYADFEIQRWPPESAIDDLRDFLGRQPKQSCTLEVDVIYTSHEARHAAA